MLASQDDEAEDEGETTVYFDAQEGTFMNEDGEEITVDVDVEEEEDDDEELEDDEDEDEGGEGGETPAATTEASTGGPRTVRGRFILLPRHGMKHC